MSDSALHSDDIEQFSFSDDRDIYNTVINSNQKDETGYLPSASSVSEEENTLSGSKQTTQVDRSVIEDLIEEKVNSLVDKKLAKVKKEKKHLKMSYTISATAVVTATLCFFGNYFSPWNPPHEVVDLAKQFTVYCDNRNLNYSVCIEEVTNITNKLDGATCGLTEKQHETEKKEITKQIEIKTKEITEQLETCKDSNQEHKDKIQKLNEKLDMVEIKTNINKEVADYSDNSKTDKGIFILVTFMLAVGEFIIIVLFFWVKNALKNKMYETNEERSTRNGNVPRSNRSEIRGIRSVLDDIHRRTDLNNRLCILSFFASNQEKHCIMVNSFVDDKIQKDKFLVTKHDDLKCLPSCKLFIMFVDFNERHIILESKREMGDLKKTTVNAIWKIGATVILVYCGNKYAEPKGDNLYNEQLVSIKEHQELSKLESNGCVLTVNGNKFTEYQKKHLHNLTGYLKGVP